MSEDLFKNLGDSLKGIKLPEITNISSAVVNRNFGFGEEQEKLMKVVAEVNEEKYQREVENNENLKALVNYNEEISSYNRELVSLNEKILNKINSLDDTLLFLNNAFDKKACFDKALGQEHNALLLELILIIESKDPTKLQTFMSGVATPIGVGLIVEYLKMKLGLTSM